MKYAHSTRLFEWYASTALFMLGVHLFVWPDALQYSRFIQITAAVNQVGLMLICLLVGGTRLFALATMGKWLPWCARVRAICSIFAACVWVQLGLALFLNKPAPPSPGVPIYFTLAIAELMSVYRARRDANGRCSR